MKVLVVGEFRWEIYEKAFYHAFGKMGYETYKFGWSDYYSSNNTFSCLLNKVENRYLLGKKLIGMNNDLYNMCKKITPDLVFIYRGTHILPNTIKKIKKIGATVFAYNNDDPFGKSVSSFYWRHFINGLQYYDYIFAYREKNIMDYNNLGYHNVGILRSYYIESRNFPVENLGDNEYISDVSFIGHYEEDGRDEYIKSLIENGIDVKVYGDRENWIKSEYFNFIEENCGEIKQVRKDYNLAICSAKIALVFLSKVNNDTYTRRCFEIPAAKVMMLCEDTQDMRTMFSSGEEAVYFTDVKDCLKKVKYYLDNSEERIYVAEKGYERLFADGHEVKDRVRQVIKKYHSYK